MTSTHRTAVITVLKCFMQMLLIELQHHLMFLLKVQLVFAAAAYSATKPPFEICSKFDVLLISKQPKHR